MDKFLKVITFILCFVGGAFIGYAVVDDFMLTYLIIGIVLLVIGIVLSIVDSFIKHKNVKKNRTTLYVPFNCDKQIVENLIQKNLTDKKYKSIMYGEEPAYKHGDGFLTARKLIKYTLSENLVTIECWISVGLGNNPNTEMPIDHKFVGSLPKKHVQTFVTNIIKQIEELNKTQNTETIE